MTARDFIHEAFNRIDSIKCDTSFFLLKNKLIAIHLPGALAKYVRGYSPLSIVR